MSLESEVNDYFMKHNVNYTNNCDSKKQLDFSFRTKNGETFYLELKEKIQRINMDNWIKTDTPERDLFILDELSARKMFKFAPYSGLIIKDNILSTFYFIDVFTLFMMPKIRVNRAISDSCMKGKWLLDLRGIQPLEAIENAFIMIGKYIIKDLIRLDSQSKCWELDFDKIIPVSGVMRSKEWKKHDYSITR